MCWRVTPGLLSNNTANLGHGIQISQRNGCRKRRSQQGGDVYCTAAVAFGCCKISVHRANKLEAPGNVAELIIVYN